MGDYTMQASFDATQQPVLQGVNALFSDFGGNCRPLDLDFAAEDLLLGGGYDAQQEAWHRNAALTNIAAHGAAIRGMVTADAGGSLQPAWKAWSPSDDPRNDMEHSSEDSLPSTSRVRHQQPTPSNVSSAWPVPEVKAEASSNPLLDPTAERPKMSAKQVAQAAREQERAEKLKEKNKRAQRKFRQRQKDRQESAERMAIELAEELQKVRLEKEVLESRTRALEQALGDQAKHVDVRQGTQQEPEPTFVPAKGWNEFHPMGGLILVATCSPPRKFTHRQMMSLSFRDIAKVLIELTRRLKECLTALNLQSPNPTAEARIKALLWERHAVMAYMAVNRPKTVYQVLSSKMVDPPQPECEAPPPDLWEKVLGKIQMTEEQQKNVMDARVIYIKKVGQALLERQNIRRQLQELEIIPTTVEGFRVAAIHLKWAELVAELKENIDLCHRCNSYFMARLWYRDCFTPIQVATFITEAHPYPVDIFAIIKVLVTQLGAPTYMELLQKEYGKEKIAKATIPLDSYVDTWPATLVPEEAVEAYRLVQKDYDDPPDHHIAKFSDRVPNDQSVIS